MTQEKRPEAMLDHEWRDFALRCFGNISEQQYIDLRRTFYAGASALFFLMISRLDSGDEPTDRDLQMVHNLRDEIKRFNDDVKAGRA